MPNSITSSYTSGVVLQDRIRIALNFAALNLKDVLAADV